MQTSDFWNLDWYGDWKQVTDTAASNLKGLALAPGALRIIERAALQQLVSSHQGSRADLANKPGMSERYLYRKLKALK